jgi:hypothetical protein
MGIVGHRVENYVRINESQSVVTPQQRHDLVGARAGSGNAYHSVERVRSRCLHAGFPQDDLALTVDGALVHFQTASEIAPTPSCYAVIGWRRTESGRPTTNIRFSTATPMAASVCWAAKPRARSRGPIGVL